MPFPLPSFILSALVARGWPGLASGPTQANSQIPTQANSLDTLQILTTTLNI